MKSDLFKALKILRAWFLQNHQDNDKNNAEIG